MIMACFIQADIHVHQQQERGGVGEGEEGEPRERGGGEGHKCYRPTQWVRFKTEKEKIVCFDEEEGEW